MTTDEAPVRWRNRIVGSGVVPADELLANPRNWRTHGGAQRNAIRGSLAEVGWVQQVIVNRTTGHVVDGHARVEEALTLGEAVPVLYVELTDAEEALVLATLDPISAMAGTDRVQLTELLAEVRVDDAGLARLLVDMGGPEGRAVGETDPDSLPPARVPTVARGELWMLGEHRLLIGDATDGRDVARLLAGSELDVVWTDPPYGVDYTGKTEEALELANDALSPDATRALLAGALRLAPLRAGGVFWIAAPAGPALRAFLEAIDDAGWRLHELVVWVKDRFVLGHSDLHYRHENVLVGDVNGRDATSIAYGWREGERHTYLGGRRLDTAWEIPRPAASREHPTMKPVELVAKALEIGSEKGALVYDPFVGSGTTIIAAAETGRRAVAMEIDPVYAQVAIDRWEAFTGRIAERADG